MAYNTRRSGGGVGGGDRIFNSISSGRGRGMSQNFVSGGQYQNNQKPGVQMGPQVSAQQRPPMQPFKPQQQLYSNSPFSTSQQGFPQSQPPTLHQPAATLPPAPLKSALKKTEVKTEASVSSMQDLNIQQVPSMQQQQNIIPAQQISPIPTSSQQPLVPPTLDLDSKSEETGEVKKKTLIIKGKISKKEKRGRRNKRLRKMLMPKNALMILNELCAGHKFTFIEKDSQNPASPYYVDPDTYVASVTIDGTEHVGYAKSKIGAKTAAAENALRHIVLTKIGTQKSSVASTPAGSDNESDSKMELDAEQQDEDEVSWLHVASFAMHKLFASWYADGDDKSEQAKFMAQAGMGDITSQLRDAKAALANVAKATKQRRPAKQLPANPHLLNPVMLLNQMRDDVTYEEVCKDGNPPNIMFTYKTIVDGWEFYGRGGNKKIARRNCAYAACSKLYELSYPLDEYDPATTSCNPSANKPMSIENNVSMLMADDNDFESLV